MNIRSTPSAPRWRKLAMTLSAFVALVALLEGAAHAATIDTFSPQGEVATVRQARTSFSEPAVRFGDPALAAPFDVHCAAPGSGRWVDARTWVYDFNADLSAGERCDFSLKPGFTLVSGARVDGKTRFDFSTGGPAILRAMPGSGEIAEDQAFVLLLNGAARADSVTRNAWCEVSGIGERIGVRLLPDAERKLLIHNQRLDDKAARVVVLACARRLPAEARARLVWGRGILSVSGVASSTERHLDYTVRREFRASFSCERENAQAPCTPIRPLRVEFSAPLSRAQAQQMRIVAPDGKHAPWFDPQDKADAVSSVEFRPPFPEQAELVVEAPAGLKDDAGRPLVNAGLFPLRTRTAAAPPLAKFAAAPFGILELNADPALPVSLRHVEPNLSVKGVAITGGSVRDVRVSDDAAIIGWFAKVKRFHESSLPQSQLAAALAPTPGVVIGAGHRNEPMIETRAISLLNREPGARMLSLPAAPAGAARALEVVGIPMPEPGFHVVEIESQQLGAALLGKAAPMYVRTTVLVTNLGVHFKLGAVNSGVWVTSLDQGKPVAGAAVSVSTCLGQVLWTGSTDASGFAPVPRALDTPNWQRCRGSEPAYFVSARKTDARGRADMAFVWSNWNEGIENWRFQVPTSWNGADPLRLHTVFDRSLLRAGQTVSMKHYARVELLTGLGDPAPAQLPDLLTIEHVGSGQKFEMPLTWRGARHAESSFAIPEGAKLGVYVARMTVPRMNGQHSVETGQFRVEEFRLPAMQGRIVPPPGVLVNPRELPLNIQLGYTNGGGAANAALRVSALLRPRSPHYTGYEAFSFEREQTGRNDDDESSSDGPDRAGTNAANPQKIVADKLPLTLDRNGAGSLRLPDLPRTVAPADLLVEATYADPNGEMQTLSQTVPLAPSGVVVGIQSERWISVRQKLAFKALALDTRGKPAAGVAVTVRGVLHNTRSTRKRLVGGFYAYDNQRDDRPLGVLCKGNSDAQGLLLCDIGMTESGNVELIAEARDGAGNPATASVSVWAARDGEVWFGGENQDRMDVLPEKRAYEPGETARFQVRMPFRAATALVAIERDGIIETRVVNISGKDPSIAVPVKAEWAPNVFVSVLAVRGRVRDVPWYSFFTWGWSAPLEWWRAWRDEGQVYQAPGALVDLSKPAFKLGLAEIQVGAAAHRLKVTVTPDKSEYPIRAVARVRIQVRLPDGKPAPAGSEVALAAVDEALLELQANDSWNLLEAMIRRRAYGVQTATAQMQIVGKRHFGRKAVPAGGGGGKSATRELFDTLLLWNPRVVLDASGAATVEVPFNDALTAFRIVAVADGGSDRFGTGSATVRTTQDLQIVTGLPPLVREGDHYRAGFTLRNTTRQAMDVRVEASAAALGPLPARQLRIEAGGAGSAEWDVVAPFDVAQLDWTVAARATAGSTAGTTASASDRLRASQRVTAALPVTVRQATLLQLDRAISLPVAAPADAVANAATGAAPRGGIAIGLKPRLADGLPGVRRYFEQYPYACLEQKTSIAIGLADAQRWQAVMKQLPLYLDRDGLANYFPPRAGDASDAGSDVLTAYLLAAADEAGLAIPDDSRNQMESGLIAFVEGRVKRDGWSPQRDLDVRKLAALEALSRTGKAQARMLGSIQILPNQWPTSALIDWLLILRRVADIPAREQRRAEVEQMLRARLTYAGTRLDFSTEAGDFWWWLMASGDGNAARLVLAVLDAPAWKDDLPRLVNGMLQRQTHGHWLTTTANVWGTLAVGKFSQRFERDAVTGTTRAGLDVAGRAAGAQSLDWARNGAGGALMLPWPGREAATLRVAQEGGGKPWLSVQSLAAVPLKAPFASGYRIVKTVTPLEQKQAGVYTRGDVLRVKLDIDAQTDMNWVVISDPVPGGASILGTGLGRDSQIADSRADIGTDSGADSANADDRNGGWAWPAYEEKSFEAMRSYYRHVPKGKFSIVYTIRLNNVGEFGLPPTRVEAMYAPDLFGETPNAVLKVQ